MSKSSHTRARARTNPPTAKDAERTVRGGPVEVVEIAVGPNVDGHDDQARNAHAADETDASASDSPSAQES